MKSHVADWRTVVRCARIEPVGDQPIIRLAGYPTPIVMSGGQEYQVESGYEFSGISSTSDMSASSVDLEGILRMGALTADDLASGVYDNARIYVFATSWTNPIEDEEPLGLYFFGKCETTEEKYTAQLMGLKDALSQNVGRTYAALCGWTLFDQSINGRIIASTRSRCIGPRSNPDGPDINDYLVTGALTAVTSQREFNDSGRTEADDWFGYGSIMFTSGNNVGLRPSQVKVFGSGRIELHEPLFYMPQVGDTYKMIPGCRKRLVEDCIGKYGNGINHGGQAHVPSKSQYTQFGRGA